VTKLIIAALTWLFGLFSRKQETADASRDRVEVDQAVSDMSDAAVDRSVSKWEHK